jgi:hypothetical protein
LSASSAANSSATNAASSATASANSATAAANSATAAASSESTTETLYDSFDERYLGAKASDPTTNNQGGALIEGAVYWNSVTDTLKVYSGTAWVIQSGVGTVTSVSGTGSVNGITLTGAVTSSGSLTLGGSLVSVDGGTY